MVSTEGPATHGTPRPPVRWESEEDLLDSESIPEPHTLPSVVLLLEFQTRLGRLLVRTLLSRGTMGLVPNSVRGVGRRRIVRVSRTQRGCPYPPSPGLVLSVRTFRLSTFPVVDTDLRSKVQVVPRTQGSDVGYRTRFLRFLETGEVDDGVRDRQSAVQKMSRSYKRR